MTSSNGNILPHKGQWRGALMSSLICVWINGWENKRKAGDLTMKIWWCIASDRQILWPQLEVVFGSHVGFRYLILAFHHFSRPIFWKWTQEGPGNQNFSCYQFFIIIYIYTLSSLSLCDQKENANLAVLWPYYFPWTIFSIKGDHFQWRM